MPPHIERRYQLSYPEIDGLPTREFRGKYYTWKSTLKRFGESAFHAFQLSREQVSDLHNAKFLEADKFFLEQLSRLLLVPRFVEALNVFFLPKENTQILFSEKSSSKTVWIQIINAVEHYLVVKERGPLYNVTDLYREDIIRFFSEIRNSPILDRARTLDSAMSFVELPGMLEFIHRDYALHPDPKENRLMGWSKVFPTDDHFRKYALHPNREKIHQEISLDVLIKVYSSLFDRRNVAPDFWLEHPALLRLVTKLLELYPDPKLIHAGDRRLLFQMMMSCLGRHGVDEVELLSEVFARWQPQPDKYFAQASTFQNKEASHLTPEDEFYFFYNTTGDKFEALQMLSVASQREWLSRIKSGDPVVHPGNETALSAPGLQSVRKSIRKRKHIPESLSAKELLPDAQRANWLQDPYHPLHNKMSMGGFEIEANFPAEMTNHTLAPHLYRVIGQFGYRNGNDVPTELAPDPLVRPESVIGQFQDYINSGLLDVHAEVCQSAHVNVEVLTRAHYAYLFRLNYLTGRGNHPLYPHEHAANPKQPTPGQYHQLAIYEKESEVQHNVPADRRFYVEGKGYRLTAPNDFQSVIRTNMMLGSAARAYERSWCTLRGVPPEVYRTNQQTSEVHYDVTLSRNDILQIKDPTDRALAQVWYDFMYDANTLTRHPSFPLRDFWKPSCLNTEVTRLGRVVREVFPTPYHHDDEQALYKVSSLHPPITFDDQIFPNVLVAARYMSEKHIQQVRRIYSRHLHDFRDQVLAAFDVPPGAGQHLRRDKVLGQVYGPKIFSELSPTQRRELLEKIRFFLFEDPTLQEHDYNIPS